MAESRKKENDNLKCSLFLFFGCDNQNFSYFCRKNISMKYTLVKKQGKDGFLIGQLKELPAVFTQGLTISELKENIADALELYLEDMRENYQPQAF